MNSLSWFVYATQVTDDLRNAVFIIVVGGIICVITAGFFRLVTGDDKDFASLHQRYDIWAKRIIVFTLIALPGIALIPSRQTMLLIASSEVGERLVKSEAVTDIVNPGADLLKTWIKNETAKLAKEAAK